jgi:hypothetical protein
MSLSLNTTSAASFRAYVQDYYDTLLTDLFVSFKSAPLFTSHEGVKGKLTLTKLTTADLVRRYSSTFAPVTDAFTFAPRHLDVTDAKVDLKIIPKEFESSYLGMYRQKGQNSMDLPFEGYILADAMKKIQSEMEFAIWRAAAAGSPASTDKLIALFDGIREIIKDEITATTLTPIATGAITNVNAVASVEAVHAGLGDAYLDNVVDIFLNPLDKIKFIQDYRERYGKYTTQADGSIALETGNAMIHVVSGVPANCILATPKENIHYGYDGAMDASMFNFEQEDRSIKMWLDFKMGVNFGIVNDDIIAINNQWTV